LYLEVFEKPPHHFGWRWIEVSQYETLGNDYILTRYLDSLENLFSGLLFVHKT
jgi:hypothetical protein